MTSVAHPPSRRTLDAATFPRVARYVASLPRGLLSHPECECKASVYREALANLPRPLPVERLDALLADYFENPMPVSTWIPEVVNTAAYLAIADACFASESEFLDWIESFASRTFQSPMYRVLMLVASPELLARGGQRRWAAFHLGSEYESKLGESATVTTIRSPENTFDSLAVRGTLRSIKSAYRATGAKQATVELLDFSSTHFVYRANWYPERAARR